MTSPAPASPKSDPEDKPVATRKQIIWCLAGIILMWLIIPAIGLVAGKPDGSGTVGDSFGSVTALFTGMAFAGLIYTILLQRRELQLQRRELQLTREVMDEQRIEMQSSAAAQAEIAKVQRETASIMEKQSDNQLIVAKVEAARSAQSIIRESIQFTDSMLAGYRALTSDMQGRIGRLTEEELKRYERLTGFIREANEKMNKLVSDRDVMNETILSLTMELVVSPAASKKK